MSKVHSYDLILSEEIKQNIINDYVNNLLSIKEVMSKYQVKSKNYITKLLGNKMRTISESNKIAHKKHPESFKHSEEAKAKIRARRLAYMKAHPEKTAWRKKNLSYPEQQFIKFLQEYGYDKKYHIERELSIFPFFVDFAFTDQKIAIEIDGSQHLLPERKAKDDEKDTLLIEQGWKVIRFTENLIKTDWNTIHEILSNYLNDENVSDSIVVGIFTKPKGYKRLTENGYTQKQLDSWAKQKRVKKEPIKEELEDLISKFSMAAIAREYGISATAMKKWYKKFKINYHKNKPIKIDKLVKLNCVCLKCGTLFHSSIKNAKFCSDECQVQFETSIPDIQILQDISHNKFNMRYLSLKYGVCAKTISTWKKYYKENILNK